ncbi:MAG: hypothetical protein H7A43_05945 [Verrucomicrobia bacterium]|nr:hypothetical protein [Verrucomicrobiota bacterium]
MKFRLVIVAILMTALCGCNPNDYLSNMMNRMAPDDDEALAKQCLSALLAGDFKIVTEQLDPQFVKPGIESNLTQVAAMLDHGDPLSLELVGCNVFTTPDKKRSHLTYQYQFTNAWVLAAITIDTVDGNKKVFGLNVNPIPKSLGELNAFTLSGKGIQHYVLLALAVAVPIFIIWTFVLCVRTKIRKKWLWIIFILVGIAKLNLNWTTGQMGFQPIALQIPGAGMAKMGLYAPWILTVSFPLGAILFLIKRRKLQSNQEQENTEPSPPAYPEGRADAPSGSAEA